MKKVSRKKPVMLILMTLILMIFPTMSYAQSTAQPDCDCDEIEKGNDPSVVLEGEEKLQYLEILEESRNFKENVSTEAIAKDKSQVIHMIANEESKANKVDEFILISGALENDAETIFYGFVDMTTNEVKRVVHFDFDIGADTVNLKDYDDSGALFYSSTGSIDEFQNGEMLVLSEQDPGEITVQAPSDEWWYSWACSFSGIVACTAGCVAFGPLAGVCATACSYVFSNALC